jgi:hypothetical protein
MLILAPFASEVSALAHAEHWKVQSSIAASKSVVAVERPVPNVGCQHRVKAEPSLKLECYAAMSRMVTALAESIGLTVIAEGMKTVDQRDFLASPGSHACLDYLFWPTLATQRI